MRAAIFQDCSVLLQPKEFLQSRRALEARYSTAQAQAYTRWLSTNHYENFHVVSWLLPKRLHQDFFNVYSYCRWADDLADEIGDKPESLRLLAWWGAQLDSMYEGEARHPVFVALASTVKRHHIPREPFADLLRAFQQDQVVSRYETYEDVFKYCRYSANPVGRLVLYLCGYSDVERQRLSDFTCTALQLANFWQDVTVDLAKDRIYIPMEVLRRYGCPVEDVQERRPTLQFRSAMRELVDRTRELFRKGLPLSSMVERRLAVDISLFSNGGLRVLQKIERRGYDVLSDRPAISKPERAGILIGTVLGMVFRKAA
jgi:squalene synthase HpnC